MVTWGILPDGFLGTENICQLFKTQEGEDTRERIGVPNSWWNNMAETTQWLTFYDKQRALLSLGIFGKYAVFLYRTLSLEAVLARLLTIYSENNAESTFKQIVCVCVCVSVCVCNCARVRACNSHEKWKRVSSQLLFWYVVSMGFHSFIGLVKYGWACQKQYHAHNIIVLVEEWLHHSTCLWS